MDHTVDVNELTDGEGCCVTPESGYAADCAGSADEGRGEGVVAGAIVDVSVVGEDAGGEDLDYCAS